MTQEIQNFLITNRIGVLSVTLQDGSPHAATVHYSHNDNPLEIYVSTSTKSKKCEPLLNGQTVKASFVVGFREEEMLTLQMDGDISRVTEQEELAEIHTLHYKKHPHAEKYKDDPETAFLKFVPTWWRFSDYSAGKPRIVTQ